MNARQAAAAHNQEVFASTAHPGGGPHSASKLRSPPCMDSVLNNLDRCSYTAMNEVDASKDIPVFTVGAPLQLA